MTTRKFYSYKLKAMIRQLRKSAAKKMWEDGQTIYLLPSSVYFDSEWITPMPTSKGTSHHDTFESLIDEFAYYNCNNQFGRRIHYFAIDEKL